MNSINSLLDSDQQPPDTRLRLEEFFNSLGIAEQLFLDKPHSKTVANEVLNTFLNGSMENAANSFFHDEYALKSRNFEREIIQYFAKLTHAYYEKIWGYVTTGTTEGNMYGLYLAREVFPDGLVYYSEATNNNIPKILRMLGIPNIQIRTLENGEIDYQDLYESMRINRDVPAIIFANIGTMMLGAVDNLIEIKKIIQDLAIQHYYIHCDATLSGMILPFIESSQVFDFSMGIDSLYISGQQITGALVPCGVVLAKKQNVKKLSRAVEYMPTADTRISGSRNALAILFLWYAINENRNTGFAQNAKHCLQIADYTIKQLATLNIEAWRNTNSITVVFPKQYEAILNKWHVHMQDNLAHIITLPHIQTDYIDHLIDDLKLFKLSNAPASISQP